MLHTYILAAEVVFSALALIFVLSLLRRDESLPTVFYGPIIVAAAAATYFVDARFAPRQILVFFMVAFWGLRLGVHIFLKNSDRGLDWRAEQWKRKEEGSGSPLLVRFLRVVLLQGAVKMAVLTPVLLVMGDSGAPLKGRDWLGAAIWLTGFLVESVSDNELLAWKKVPGHEGHLVTTGLWRFSRHPNYFGEVVAWWGIFLVGLGVRGGWCGIASPLLVTFLILFVTGIPMAERKYRDHPRWKEYAASTSSFIPWFPRKGA